MNATIQAKKTHTQHSYKPFTQHNNIIIEHEKLFVIVNQLDSYEG
jgi:hypothetical protein